METGKAIYYLLKDSSAVGAICADRIYPEIAQQDADAPFIAYTVIDTTPSGTKSGSSSLDTARCEIYMISDDYAQAMELAIAVRTALDRQGGNIGPAGNTVAVQSIDFESSDIDHDQEHGVYIVEHTYNIRVQRTGQAPTVSLAPSNTITVEEADGSPSGRANKLIFSNGTVTLDGFTATVASGGGGSLTVQETGGANSNTADTIEFPADSVTHDAGKATIDFSQAIASALGDVDNGSEVYFPNGLYGDFDQDGNVGSADLLALLAVYGNQLDDEALAIDRVSDALDDGDSMLFVNAQMSQAAATVTALTNAGHTVEYFEGVNTALGRGFKSQFQADTVTGYTVRRTVYISGTSFPTALSQFQAYPLGPYDDQSKSFIVSVINAYMESVTANGSIVIIRTLVSASADLLLDTYTGAAAAYSVRKLDKDYNLSCMRIREDSGDTETDIGFDSNGDLDTASIASHCGSANGYVVTWYDQSGNANNATQSTASAQPQIYNGTAVITENGKPALQLGRSPLKQLTTSAISWNTAFTAATVLQPTDDGAFYIKNWSIGSDATTRGYAHISMTGENAIDWQGNDSAMFGDGYASSSYPRIITTGSAFTSGSQALSFLSLNSTAATLHVDGSEPTYRVQQTGNTSSDSDILYINGGTTTGQGMNGTMQELIIWASNQSSNRSGIQTNINNYFSIFT